MAAAAMNEKSRSRNPFLDQSEELDDSAPLQKPLSPTRMRTGTSPPIPNDGPGDLIDPFVRKTMRARAQCLQNTDES